MLCFFCVHNFFFTNTEKPVSGTGVPVAEENQ